MSKKICGNCFSLMRGNVCPECGAAVRHSKTEYDALPVGTLLNGRYTTGRILGRGGFGITYLAYDAKSEKAVAVKEFYPDEIAVRSGDNVTVEPITTQHLQAYNSGLERFMNEAGIISRFRESAEILGVYDIFRANSTAYYAMEFVKGVSLKRYVELNGAITEGQAVCTALRLLPALGVIHSADTLHRDVCPDNIMLCSNSAIKLIDFGSARTIEQKSQSMSVILKPGFAPLEQYQRKGRQDGRTDLYSLGASLYYGLIKEAPEDPMTRLNSDEGFTEKLRDVSAPLAEIISKAAAIKAEERYNNAEEMLEDIKSCGIEPEDFPAESINEAESFYKIAVSPAVRRKPAAGRAIASAISGLFGGERSKVKIGGEMYPVDITELDLSERKLTNTQVLNLRHLVKLTHLNLNYNYITDLSFLENLVNLEELHFNCNNVQDIGFLKNMKRLKRFSAENTGVDDISVLSDKTKLISVFVGDSLVTDITPLKNCRDLREAGFNELPIGSLEPLRKMTKLEKVCLAGCGLKDISPLSNSKSLKYVYLGRNELTDLSPLVGCDIKELFIDNNSLSGHIDTFAGITLNGFAAIENNGFSNEEIEAIKHTLQGDFQLYDGY